VLLQMLALLFPFWMISILQDPSVICIVYDMLGRRLLLLLILRNVCLKFHSVGIVLDLFGLRMVPQFGAELNIVGIVVVNIQICFVDRVLAIIVQSIVPLNFGA
jgi:hypothetical protein